LTQSQPILLRHRLKKCRQAPFPHVITEIKPGLTLALTTRKITKQEENCHLGGNRFLGERSQEEREMYGIGSVDRKRQEALRMTAGDVP
jgi:hypothetical protein